MKNYTIPVIVLILIVLGVVVYAMRTAQNSTNINTNTTTTENPTPVAENNVGCYVAKLGKDVYTLRIDSENGTDFAGRLNFKNFEKDSSSGMYTGTFSNGILLGNYSFDSEGMHSDRQVIFQKSSDNFVEGFGDYKTVAGKEVFADLSKITYDPKYTFVKSTECVND